MEMVTFSFNTTDCDKMKSIVRKSDAAKSTVTWRLAPGNFVVYRAEVCAYMPCGTYISN